MPKVTNAARRRRRTRTRNPAAAGASARPGRRAGRYRRALFLVAIGLLTGAAGLVFVIFQVPLPPAPDLSQTTFLTDADGNRLAVLHGGENRVSVPLERVPRVVRDAVIATEDRNFFRHGGVDPVGVMRATWADIRNRGALQGGSTITQQYVKNTYVGRERSLWRKVREAVIAVKLERELDKEEILERYLNTIYLGRGAWGVQAASQAYFGKDVGQLGLPEAAYLAGLIRSPQTGDVTRDPDRARRRRDQTLVSMEEEGYIDRAQRAEVAAMPVQSYVQPRAVVNEQARVTAADKGTAYFVEYVRRFLVQRYGEKAVYTGGLRVKTTLDLRTQSQAYDAVYGLLDRDGDPAGALVALDGDGRVRAMVGGRDWNADTPFAKVNLAVGREGGGRGRQGGSTFKAFVLAEAVREGYTVESSFPAPAKIVLDKANNGKDWPVENYESASFGRVNLIDATKKSINTVYAQLVTRLGPDKVVALAKSLGITSPLRPFPSIALGTEDVSVLEMASAYLTFANRGVGAAPQVLLEVTDADGDLVERFSPRRERVLDEEDADVVNFVLEQAVERGTGTGARIGKPVAGKTGTTQNYGDAWFVGYTPKLTAAVWMGYPEGQARDMRNVRGTRVSGGSFPATIFKRFMTAATAGVDTGEFAEVRKFPGKVLDGGRITFRVAGEGEGDGGGEDGAGQDGATTTTSSPPEAPATTGTTGDPAAPTTTDPPGRTGTTAPPSPTTTAPPSTTAPPRSRSTTPTTSGPPPTTAPEGQGATG